MRRCGAFAIPAWAGVAVRRPSATDGFGFRFGGRGNLFAVAEASAEFGDNHRTSPAAVLLSELVQVKTSIYFVGALQLLLLYFNLRIILYLFLFWRRHEICKFCALFNVVDFFHLGEVLNAHH